MTKIGTVREHTLPRTAAAGPGAPKKTDEAAAATDTVALSGGASESSAASRPPAAGMKASAMNAITKAAIALMNVRVPTTAKPLSADEVEKVKSLIQPGDILLDIDFQYPGWQLMEKVSVDSDWTHASLYDGKGNVIEAVPGSGVSMRTLDELLSSHAVALVRPPYGSEKERDASIAYAASQLGKPYDEAFNIGDDGELYCAELVADALGSANPALYETLPKHRFAGKEMMGPAAFLEMPGASVVYDSGFSFAKSLLSHWPIGLAAGMGGVAGSLLGPLGACLGFGVALTAAVKIGQLIQAPNK